MTDQPRFVLPDGLHFDIPHDVYHADPCAHPSLSSHVAQVVVGKSAGHAALIHPRLGGKRSKESSDAMDVGSILHGMLLGGGAELVEVNEKDWRKDVAKDARAKAEGEGKIAVLKDKLVRLRTAADWLLCVFAAVLAWAVLS